MEKSTPLGLTRPLQVGCSPQPMQYDWQVFELDRNCNVSLIEFERAGALLLDWFGARLRLQFSIGRNRNVCVHRQGRGAYLSE